MFIVQIKININLFLEIECQLPLITDDSVKILDKNNDLVAEDGTFILNSNIHFKCSIGYRLLGSDEANCDVTGEFVFSDGEEPKCKGDKLYKPNCTDNRRNFIGTI